jgi:exosome complex exonuclease RRP6
LSHALITEVLSRSEDTALRIYEKEVYDAEHGTGSIGWDTLAKKWNKGALLNHSVQRTVFLRVHGWRDGVAREEDESVRYIFSPSLHVLNLGMLIH